MGLKPLAGTEGGYALFRDQQAAETAYLYGKHPRGLSADVAPPGRCWPTRRPTTGLAQ